MIIIYQALRSTKWYVYYAVFHTQARDKTLQSHDCGHYASGSMFAGIGVVSSSPSALASCRPGHFLLQTVPHLPELSILTLTNVLATSGQRLVMHLFLHLMYPSRQKLRQFLRNLGLESERTHLHFLELRISDKKAIHLHLPKHFRKWRTHCLRHANGDATLSNSVFQLPNILYWTRQPPRQQRPNGLQGRVTLELYLTLQVSRRPSAMTHSRASVKRLAMDLFMLNDVVEVYWRTLRNCWLWIIVELDFNDRWLDSTKVRRKRDVYILYCCDAHTYYMCIYCWLLSILFLSIQVSERSNNRGTSTGRFEIGRNCWSTVRLCQWIMCRSRESCNILWVRQRFT